MAQLKVSEEGILSLSARGVALVSGLLALMITVATTTATLISRNKEFATQNQIREAIARDSIMAVDIRSVRIDHEAYRANIADLKTQLMENAALTRIVINRQNLTLCKLFGTGSSVCNSAVNSR